MAKTATNVGPIDLSSDVPPSRDIYINVKVDRCISLFIFIFFTCFFFFLSGNACNR